MQKNTEKKSLSCLTSESTANTFAIAALPRAGNKRNINILGAEFSRFAELEAQKFSYVNM